MQRARSLIGIGGAGIAVLLLFTGYLLGTQHSLAPSHVVAADDCQTFTQTGHQVCGAFLQYWDDHGGLAQQGYPISDPMSEVSATDGNTYQVQYFERAVFELHPELTAPDNVLLSLLGTQKYNAKYANNGMVVPSMVAAVAATPTAATPTPTGTAIVATVPVAASATVTPVPTVSATNTATAVPTGTVTTPPALVTATAVLPPVATNFTSVPAPVRHGGNATASVQTVSNAACSIAVVYKAGESTAAAGLVDKTASAAGMVSWTWTVGRHITPGTWPVTVTCTSDGRSATAHTTIQVT